MEIITKEEVPSAAADKPAAKSELHKTMNSNKSDQEQDTKESEKLDDSNHEQNNHNKDINNKPNAMTEEEILRADDGSKEETIPVHKVDPKSGGESMTNGFTR